VVHGGRYRARASRRVDREKADGRQRPLGIAALEDKVVQQAVVTILNEIYEVDFKGFSYGFRPGRSPHRALDALSVGLHRKRVNWVLDADIRGFFDNMSHEWTVKFIEHRVGDPRMIRLIQKWLKAGVSEEGQLPFYTSTRQVFQTSPKRSNGSPATTLNPASDAWPRTHSNPSPSFRRVGYGVNTGTCIPDNFARTRHRLLLEALERIKPSLDSSRADRRGMLTAALCFVHCVAGPVLLSFCGVSVPGQRLGKVRATVPAWVRCHGRDCSGSRVPEKTRPGFLPGVVRLGNPVLASARSIRRT
jgi:hypothetical protein